MNIVNVLKNINIECSCEKTGEFESLGLVGYNKGNNVCTFIENEKYINDLSHNVSVVITNEEVGRILGKQNKNFVVCIVENPRVTYFLIHNYLSKLEGYKRTLFKTEIGNNCQISEHAIISETNVCIGNNVTVEEFAVIRENTIIGDNSIIRAGCKIGGEGFEFKTDSTIIFRVDHIGGVIIGKNVEIQYNSCIDKAIYPWDNTVIGDYVKIDNLVHVGHAVKIAERSMIIANSGIGGRTSIGKDSWIGFGATIRNGITIGNNTRANMGAVVTKSIGNNEKVTGNFAIPHDEFIAKLKKD